MEIELQREEKSATIRAKEECVLRELELERFKAFSGLETIPIRPITLIYGPNSSGKSSIIQCLLLLKQTLLEAENPNIPLLPKGKIVDLGGFREFVSNHEVRQTVSFKLSLKKEPHRRWLQLPLSPTVTNPVALKMVFGYDESLESANLSRLDLFAGAHESPVIVFKPDTGQEGTSASYGFGFESPRSRTGQTLLKVEKANYDHPFWKETWAQRTAKYKGRENELVKNLRSRKKQLQDAEVMSERQQQRLKKIEKDLERIQNYSFSVAMKDFERVNKNTFLTCSNFLPVDLRFTQMQPSDDFEMEVFGFEPMSYAPGAAATVMTAVQIRKFLEGIVYMGPLREYPERHYIFSGNLADDVGKTGSMVPDVLFKNKTLLQKVNDHFEAFRIGYRLEVASVGESKSELHDVFALRLVDRITSVNVSIVDVGFGISQVLPIIVQSMLSSNKTLLIEQPEIHLHPRLQSELATLFAEAIKEPYKNEFIVETHSEHLILRLQRLIRQKVISADDISVIYVDRTPDGSRCIPLRLDPGGGFIDRWPGGFFEEGYREMFS